MTAPVDIANLALSAIGTRSTIASFDEGSPEANEVSRWYQTTVMQILRMAYWGCARKYTNLSLLKAAPGTPENQSGATGLQPWDPSWPPPPWLYEYAYPTDCLAARFVIPAPTANISGTPIFSVSNAVSPASVMGPPVKSVVTIDTDATGNTIKCICTNQPQATLCYTADVEDCNVWDQGLQQSVIYGLGAAIALQLTGDKGTMDRLFKLANQTVMQARQMNANESLATQDVIPDWIRVRGINLNWDGSTYMLDQYGPLFPTAI